MPLVGYAWVGADDPNPSLQRDALRAYGCEQLFTDVTSPQRPGRPRLEAALAATGPGDTLVTWSLDRLGDTMPEARQRARALLAKGAQLRTFDDAIDTTRPQGRARLDDPPTHLPSPWHHLLPPTPPSSSPPPTTARLQHGLFDADPGPSTVPGEVLEVDGMYVLDWLYDQDPHGRSTVPLRHLFDWISADGTAAPVWRSVLRHLHQEGWAIVIRDPLSAFATAILTDAGRRLVELDRTGRSSSTQRNAAARNAVVRWLHSRAECKAPSDWAVEQGLPGALGTLRGRRFTTTELTSALRYLNDKGITIIDQRTHSRHDEKLRLTANGIDCAEHYSGDVSDYVRAHSDQAANNVTFNGPVSGNVTWASTKVRATAHTTTTGLTGDELAMLFRAVVQAIPVLGLDDERAAALRGNIDVIEAELANPEPDQHVVRTFAQRAMAALGSAAESALGLVLMGYTRALLQHADIPIE